MSRIYGEPIEAWTREGDPFQFVWRDRLYVVRQIVDHWVVAREWWKVSEDDPGERRFWRLEATPAQEVGTYELRHDTSTGQWLLLRAWD